MCYMDHAEIEWFYTHTKKPVITGQPSLHVWGEREQRGCSFSVHTSKAERIPEDALATARFSY